MVHHQASGKKTNIPPTSRKENVILKLSKLSLWRKLIINCDSWMSR